MTYTNLLSWQPLPQFEDGDIVRGGNLAGMTNVDQGKKVRFIGCNLAGCITTLEQLPSDKNLICPPFPVFEYADTDIELAAYAVAARAILDKSEKLKSPEITAYLDFLETQQKDIAGINPAPGESATLLVIKMIYKLNQRGEIAKAQELQQALDMVIDITGGVL